MFWHKNCILHKDSANRMQYQADLQITESLPIGGKDSANPIRSQIYLNCVEIQPVLLKEMTDKKTEIEKTELFYEYHGNG